MSGQIGGGRPGNRRAVVNSRQEGATALNCVTVEFRGGDIKGRIQWRKRQLPARPLLC